MKRAVSLFIPRGLPVLELAAPVFHCDTWDSLLPKSSDRALSDPTSRTNIDRFSLRMSSMLFIAGFHSEKLKNTTSKKLEKFLAMV